jgi:hypothetical protein
MKILQKTERKNGFDYNLLDRTDNCAIYEQIDYKDDGSEYIVAYEVFVIKKREESKIGDRTIEAGEVFPGNESFGSDSFSFGTIGGRYQEDALKKANEKFTKLKKLHN